MITEKRIKEISENFATSYRDIKNLVDAYKLTDEKEIFQAMNYSAVMRVSLDALFILIGKTRYPIVEI